MAQQSTELVFDPAPPASGKYGDKAAFSVRLTSQGQPLANRPIQFGLGQQTRMAFTDSDGRATVRPTLLGRPGEYDIRAIFLPTAEFNGSKVEAPFEILKQDTAINLEINTDPGQVRILATLTDAGGRRLIEQTILFIIEGEGQTFRRALITNHVGQIKINNPPLPSGSFTISAFFGGEIPVGDGRTIFLSNTSYNPSSATKSFVVDTGEPGSVTIIKKTGTPIVHDFLFKGDLGEFTLTSNSAQSAATFADVPSGTYTIGEDPDSFPDDLWALLAVTCQDVTDPNQPRPVSIQPELNKYRATFTLKSGQHLECIFLNDRANFKSYPEFSVYIPLIVR